MRKYIVRLLEFGSDKYAYLKNLPKNSSVLDIGCGDCRRLRYRSYFRGDLVHHGVDIHPDRRCEGYLETFHVLDIGKDALPFQEGFFDLVVLSHVIEHIPKRDFLFAVKEIVRVLKQGGYLYIEIPAEKTRRFTSAEKLRRLSLPVTTMNFYDDESHVSLYTIGELAGLLEEESLNVHSHGDIREPVKKYLSPVLLFIGYVLRNESIFTGSLWSIVNWASFIVARK